MTVTSNKAPTLAVGAVIRNSDGEVLLVRRGHAPRAGEWSIPGGKVEWGETVQDALHREILEETGLTIEIGHLIGVIDCPIREVSGHLSAHYVLLDYAARVRAGRAEAGSDVTELRWVLPGDVPNYEMWAETKRIIALSDQGPGATSEEPENQIR